MGLNIKIAHYIITNEEVSFLLKEHHHTQKSTRTLGYYSTLRELLKDLIGFYLKDSKSHHAITTAEGLKKELDNIYSKIEAVVPEFDMYSIVKKVDEERKADSERVKNVLAETKTKNLNIFKEEKE